MVQYTLVPCEFPAERQFTFGCVNLNQQDSFLQPVWAIWPAEKDVGHVTKPVEGLVCVCVEHHPLKVLHVQAGNDRRQW